MTYKKKIKKFQISGVVNSYVVASQGAQNAAEYSTAEEVDQRNTTMAKVNSQAITDVSVELPTRTIKSQGVDVGTEQVQQSDWMNKGGGMALQGVNAGISALSGIGYSTKGSGPNNYRDLMGATKKGAVALAGGAGALSGAAKGAAAGLSFGPIGAAVGAVAGFVGGGIGGLLAGKKRKTKAQEEIDAMTAQREEDEKSMQALMNNAAKSYSANRTRSFMQQAQSLYGAGGKHMAIARRGGIVYAPISTLYYTDNIPTKRVDFPITSKAVRKAYKGAKVVIEKETDNAVVCSKEAGVCTLMHKSESPVHQLIFRRGGSLVNKTKRNIIPHGVTHEEENSTGINGDKGIPIVKNGEKIFELEKSEWVLNSEVSNGLQKQVYQYLSNPSDDILIDIGRTVRRELLLGTYSYDEEYAHLNH